VLLYLYAEPDAWPDGRVVDPEAGRRHAAEVQAFADAVAGAEVEFAACSYRNLLGAMRASLIEEVRQHAEAISSAYNV
jgi:hypothetical protein